MTLYPLTNSKAIKHRSKLIAFIRRHGDRRITQGAINWLQQMNSQSLDTPGTKILAALDKKKLVGLLIVAQYGIEESFMAVHKEYRNQNIAKAMLKQMISDLGKIYGRVALDNISSLKACFSSGMVAFHLFQGPTNKPTLWVGGGDWKRSDVLAPQDNHILVE